MTAYSRRLAAGPVTIGKVAIPVAAGALFLYCCIHYFWASSFWLDEAFVAASLRNPRLSTIFDHLAYGQYFPRIYLACIASLREALGYRVWVLRLLPALAFVGGTAAWAWLLFQRSRSRGVLYVLGAALLLGSSFWLEQAVQLKQYTFDVLLALIPFLIADTFFEESLGEGKRKPYLVCLALPCVLSYTYPIALCARLVGWQLTVGRARGWRLRLSPVIVLGVSLALGMICIWLTDYRFDLKDAAAYAGYWQDCSLRSQVAAGAGGAPRLIAKFLWGWHAHMPLAAAGVVGLQVLGVRRVFRQWKQAGPAGDVQEARWGSRSMGSVLVLVGVLAASLLFGYPICAGRTVLFAQIHTQILAIEGGLSIVSLGRKVPATAFLYAAVCVIMTYSGVTYLQSVQSHGAEDLFPLTPLINREIAANVWVHPCSCAQVEALPQPLPAENVALGTVERAPLEGEKVWVVWTHLGDRFCRGRLAQVRCEAKKWETIYEGNESGLALAQF